MLIILTAGGLAHAAEAIPEEYKLKAAFIYNFAKFVEWPASVFPDTGTPIVIGVLGRNPFEDELLDAVKGRRINGRPIEIRQIRTAAEAGATQILFVSAGEERNFGALKNSLGIGVLPVGESALFTKQGGTINFNLLGDKLRFEINMAAARRSDLRISAQLLKLATNIHR